MVTCSKIHAELLLEILCVRTVEGKAAYLAFWYSAHSKSSLKVIYLVCLS